MWRRRTLVDALNAAYANGMRVVDSLRLYMGPFSCAEFFLRRTVISYCAKHPLVLARRADHGVISLSLSPSFTHTLSHILNEDTITQRETPADDPEHLFILFSNARVAMV